MSLCVLLSSVFVLNTKGVLNEGLFNALSLVVNISDHVEEKGQEASKPALLWLLRDFILDLRDDHDREITPDEYLDRALHQQPLSNSDPERSRGAREVRESLMKFFPQRACATFVQPTIEEEQLRRLQSVPYTQLRPEFRRQLEAFQGRLMDLARAHPKAVAGRQIGGAELAALLRQLCASLNSNRSLNVQNAWDMVQHTACAALVEELRGSFSSKVNEVIRGGSLQVPGAPSLPVRDTILRQGVKEMKNSVRSAWDNRAVGDEDVRADFWKELKGNFQMEVELLERENMKLGEAQLRKAAADWETWLSTEQEVSTDPRSEVLQRLIDKGMPSIPLGKISSEALSAARLARMKWDTRLTTVQAQMSLLNAEVNSHTHAVAAASHMDDERLEQTREMGQLQGKVRALTSQLTEAMDKDQKYREKIMESAEEARKEQRLHLEAQDKVDTQAKQIRDLEKEIESLREAAEEERDIKPKCQCVLS